MRLNNCKTLFLLNYTMLNQIISRLHNSQYKYVYNYFLSAFWYWQRDKSKYEMFAPSKICVIAVMIKITIHLVAFLSYPRAKQIFNCSICDAFNQWHCLVDVSVATVILDECCWLVEYNFSVDPHYVNACLFIHWVGMI